MEILVFFGGIVLGLIAGFAVGSVAGGSPREHSIAWNNLVDRSNEKLRRAHELMDDANVKLDRANQRYDEINARMGE